MHRIRIVGIRPPDRMRARAKLLSIVCRCVMPDSKKTEDSAALRQHRGRGLTASLVHWPVLGPGRENTRCPVLCHLSLTAVAGSRVRLYFCPIRFAHPALGSRLPAAAEKHYAGLSSRCCNPPKG